MWRRRRRHWAGPSAGTNGSTTEQTNGVAIEHVLGQSAGITAKVVAAVVVVAEPMMEMNCEQDTTRRGQRTESTAHRHRHRAARRDIYPSRGQVAIIRTCG